MHSEFTMTKYILNSLVVPDKIELSGREKLKLNMKMKITHEGNLYTLESINSGGRPEHLNDVQRSDIQQFTAQSRARLIRTIASFGALVPVFVTLTYGADYPTPKETKEHLRLWWRRIKAKHPHLFAVWKLEFQKRGAPHYHLLVYSQGKRPRIDKDFLKVSWWKATGREGLRTEIKKLRSHRGGVWYASKYLAKTEVYQPADQHNTSGQSEDALSSSDGPGRFWGILSRANVPQNKVEYMLSPTEYKMILSQALYSRAEFMLKHELAEKYDVKVSKLPFDLITSEMITEKAREIVKKSKVPVHLLSDEIGLISRISELSSMSDIHCINFIDDYFTDL